MFTLFVVTGALVALATGSIGTALIVLYRQYEVELIIITATTFLSSISVLVRLIFSNSILGDLRATVLGIVFNLATLCTVIECLNRIIHSTRIVFYSVTEERLTLGFNSLILFTLFINGIFEGYCCVLSKQRKELREIENSIGSVAVMETEKVSDLQGNTAEYRHVPLNKFVPLKDSSQTLTPEMDPDVQARNQELRLAWLMEELGKKNSMESNSFSTVIRHNMSSPITSFIRDCERTEQKTTILGRSSSLKLASPKLVLSYSGPKRKSLPPSIMNTRRSLSNSMSLRSKKRATTATLSSRTSMTNLKEQRGRSYTCHKSSSPVDKTIPSPRRITRLSTITDISRSLLNFVSSSPSSVHNDNSSRHTTEQYSPKIPEPVNAKPNDISPQTLDSPQLQMERNALERINSALLPPYLHTPDTMRSAVEVFNNPNTPTSLPDPQAAVLNVTGPAFSHLQKSYTFPEHINTPATGATAYYSPLSKINSASSNGNVNVHINISASNNNSGDTNRISDKKNVDSSISDNNNINTITNGNKYKPVMSFLEDLPEVNELTFSKSGPKRQTKQWISMPQMDIPPNVTPEMWERDKEKFLERADCLQQKIVVSSLNLDEEPHIDANVSLSSGTSKSSSGDLSMLEGKKPTLAAALETAPKKVSSGQLPREEQVSKIEGGDKRIVSDTISELEEYLHERPRTDEENEQLLIDSLKQKQVSADFLDFVPHHRPVRSLGHSPTRSIGSIISSGSAHGTLSRNNSTKAQFFHGRSNSQIQYVFPNSGSPQHSVSTQSSPRRSSSRYKYSKRLSTSGLSDGIRTPQIHSGNRHSFNGASWKGFLKGHSRGRTIDLSYISALQSQDSPVETLRRLSVAASPQSSAAHDEIRRHSVSADRMSRASTSLLHLLHLDTSRSTLLSVNEMVSSTTPSMVPPEPLEERETIADVSGSTPERSKDSDNTYPDIVMGQYDKEKWNTMLNVNIIDANGNLKD